VKRIYIPMNLPNNDKSRRRRNKKKNRKMKIPKNVKSLPIVMPPVWYCFHKYTSLVVSAANSLGSFLSFDYYINSIVSPEVSGQIHPMQLESQKCQHYITIGQFNMLKLNLM
jgi:hypothetical protein